MTFAAGRVLILLFAVLLAGTARAADALTGDCDLNDINAEIPGFKLAQIDFKPKPRYPKDALNGWSEGWVMLESEIGADGAVRNIKVIDGVGTKDFVKESVRAFSTWQYKPATRNGMPVDQYLWQVQIEYRFFDSQRNADHDYFVRQYDKARGQIRDDKFDDAIATLEGAFEKRLNQYERAMGSFMLGLAYAKKGDTAPALFHVRHAVFSKLEYLERSLQPSALSLQVDLEARNGNMHEAICAFRDLKQIDPSAARPDGGPAKIAARIEAALATPGPIAIGVVLAKHPLIEGGAVWRHRLLRPKFSFDQIEGEVKSFQLKCVGATHEAPVDAETQWDVPAKAGACILRVDGAPGASFRLIEE